MHAHHHPYGNHHEHHGSEGHDHDDHGPEHHTGRHTHAPTSFGKAFAIGITLNAAYVAAQIFYGLAAHSMALLADAVHNLGDVLGLVIAWGTMRLAQRQPTQTRTYGWGRSTILASLGNAVVLLLGCGAIALEAMHRFGHPKPVASGIVMWVAAIGILINGGTALMFMRGRKDDLNIKGAFLHMASDAVVSAGVVVAAMAIQYTGCLWLDPATSLIIAVVITLGTWSLLRDSVNLAMDAVPAGIELAAVEDALLGLPGVIEIHDLHVWALSTTETALTAHLIRLGKADADGLIQQACILVRKRFKIGHSTFQVETPGAADVCGQRPAGVV